MRYLRYSVCYLIVLALTLTFPSTSVASILPLDGNPNALVSGTENFSSGILSADIAYAVFGPSVFTNGTVGGIFDNPQLGGFDPVNDYVYAYHIANSGSTPISSLQVSLDSGGFFTDLGEDSTADPTGISPTVITPICTSAAAYLFVSTLSGGLGQIEAGQTSSVLLMSSPQSYQLPPPAYSTAAWGPQASCRRLDRMMPSSQNRPQSGPGWDSQCWVEWLHSTEPAAGYYIHLSRPLRQLPVG
jgi:hypothetical protein